MDCLLSKGIAVESQKARYWHVTYSKTISDDMHNSWFYNGYSVLRKYHLLNWYWLRQYISKLQENYDDIVEEVCPWNKTHFWRRHFKSHCYKYTKSLLYDWNCLGVQLIINHQWCHVGAKQLYMYIYVSRPHINLWKIIAVWDYATCNIVYINPCLLIRVIVLKLNVSSD